MVLTESLTDTAEKMKFPINDFFSKHLLKKSLMENFIFCAVWLFLSVKVLPLSYFLITFFKNFVIIGCPQISLLGGQAIGRNHYGAKITYECDKNYHLKNGKTRTCEYGGKWSMPVPYCESRLLLGSYI